MSRTSNGVATGVALLLGCATPGYRVSIQAKGIGSGEQYALLHSLENKARSSGGVVTVFEGKESKSFPASLSSSYVKRLSEKWRDQILISIFYFAEKERVVVDVECGLRGMEPPVKAEIDALGDMFTEELSDRVGRGRVSVERGPWSIPVLTDG